MSLLQRIIEKLRGKDSRVTSEPQQDPKAPEGYKAPEIKYAMKKPDYQDGETFWMYCKAPIKIESQGLNPLAEQYHNHSIGYFAVQFIAQIKDKIISKENADKKMEYKLVEYTDYEIIQLYGEVNFVDQSMMSKAINRSGPAIIKQQSIIQHEIDADPKKASPEMKAIANDVRHDSEAMRRFKGIEEGIEGNDLRVALDRQTEGAKKDNDSRSHQSRKYGAM